MKGRVSDGRKKRVPVAFSRAGTGYSPSCLRRMGLYPVPCQAGLGSPGGKPIQSLFFRIGAARGRTGNATGQGGGGQLPQAAGTFVYRGLASGLSRPGRYRATAFGLGGACPDQGFFKQGAVLFFWDVVRGRAREGHVG